MTNNPLTRFRAWFDEAQRAGAQAPEAMALATAGARGRPAVRFVLLKQADARGFVFFTNARSRKGRELRANPRVSAAMYWYQLGKQVRIEGRVEPVSAVEADAYWATRPRASQLAALASHQSAVLSSRRVLLQRWERLSRRLHGTPVPRPRSWTGFRIVPESVEFWTHREHRLHDRELFLRTRRGWRRVRLQP